MPARQNQLTVEVSKKTREEIEELLREGYILTVQDLLRRAIDNELERLKQSIRIRSLPLRPAAAAPDDRDAEG